jgi:hypothetical protein
LAHPGKSQIKEKCKSLQVEYLASISLLDEGWDVNMLEEACLKAARNAAKELLLQALRQVEKSLLAKEEGERKGKVRRFLTTRCGRIVLSMQKLKQQLYRRRGT